MTDQTTTQSRRELTNGSNGYFCISEGKPLLQGEIDGNRKEIHISADETITLEKMFGPLVFWSIRATADLESGDWIIEREYGPHGEWREVARIPGQLASDFTDDEEEGS